MKTTQIFNLALGLLCSCVVQAQSTTNVMNAAQFQRDFASVKLMNTQAEFSNAPESAIINYNEKKYQKFKRMKTGGIVLTSIGTGLIIGGSVLIVDGSGEHTGGLKIGVGVLSILAGTLSSGGGIAMWIIGNNNMKKYGGGQVMVQPTKNGLGLTYRF